MALDDHEAMIDAAPTSPRNEQSDAGRRGAPERRDQGDARDAPQPAPDPDHAAQLEDDDAGRSSQRSVSSWDAGPLPSYANVHSSLPAPAAVIDSFQLDASE